MPELPYMTEEAQSNIGKERVTVSDPVSARHIRQYLAGADDWNPLYYDEEQAKKGPYGEIIAPPGFHSCTNRRVVPQSRLLEDGQYDDLSVPGVYGRTIAGAQEIELFEPVRVGDIITERQRFVDILEKQGRSGKMIFVISETTYTNQRDQLIAKERDTLIFR